MKSLFNQAISASIALLLTAAAGAASAQNVPEYVRIRNISYAGTGCPAGSVASNIATDRQAFTLLFDEYVAEVGPGLAFSASRKNCAVNIDLDFPQGWSYTLLTVDYRGFASLDPGVTGIQKSSYYFQGQARTASLQTVLRGPVIKDYQIRDTLGLDALVWSPCGAQRALNINTQVRADSVSRYGRGLMTLDSIDGQLTQVYSLQWQRCF